VIRALVSESVRLLKPGGLLAMEIGHDQARTVTAMLSAAGWSEVQTVRDLAAIERVVTARRVD
jgi:release factor glutamine methyltransferase